MKKIAFVSLLFLGLLGCNKQTDSLNKKINWTLVAQGENGKSKWYIDFDSMSIKSPNIYSYKDPTQSLAGGIGIGDNRTGDFVAKFYSSNAKAINQINVSFAGSSQPFKLGIWKADGKDGAPKTNIWTSDTLISSPNFTTPVLPPVSVNGPFFVGVRQITGTNIAFGYQDDHSTSMVSLDDQLVRSLHAGQET